MQQGNSCETWLEVIWPNNNNVGCQLKTWWEADKHDICYGNTHESSSARRKTAVSMSPFFISFYTLFFFIRIHFIRISRLKFAKF